MYTSLLCRKQFDLIHNITLIKAIFFYLFYIYKVKIIIQKLVKPKTSFCNVTLNHYMMYVKDISHLKGGTMRKKVLASLLALTLAAGMLAGCGSKKEEGSEAKTEGSVEITQEAAGETGEYEPVTITLNLDRSGLGTNVDYTFTAKPTHVVADGDQMADMFFDLGLDDCMAGYVSGACVNTDYQYPNEEGVKELVEAGTNLRDVSKETVLAVEPDFLVGWDSLFSDKNYSIDFCKQHNIAPYFPYVCSDSAKFEDLYKDYETLGKIFQVEDVAAQKVQAMKDTLDEVAKTLGDDAFKNPVNVFVYDSGEDAPFTACQGMPGDILEKAGAISSFSEIEKGWATPSWEEVVAKDPDAILILEYNGDVDAKKEFLKTNTYTKDLRAVKEDKIYVANCAIMQGSAGSAELVKSIAQQLYPDKFK